MNTIRVALLASILLVAACEKEVKLISIEPVNITFTESDQRTKIKAEPQDIDGNPVPNVPISFRSDNTAVATVTDSGLVTPVANGTASIIVSTPSGKQAQAFVKVCMPEKLVCQPPAQLNLRVGTAAPIKCHLEDCKGKEVPGKIAFTYDDNMLFKDGTNTFVGKVVGDTQVTASAAGLKTTINVHVDEQIFSPGAKGGGGGGGGGGRGDRNADPYNENGGGQFNHILKNMKFK